MKLVFLLLADATIASPSNERLISDETKCCQRLKVRSFNIIILLLRPNLENLVSNYNIGCDYFKSIR